MTWVAEDGFAHPSCLGNGARDREQHNPFACIARCRQVHALQGLNRPSARSASDMQVDNTSDD